MTLTAVERAVLLADELGLSERLSRMQGQEIGPTEVVKALRAGKVRHVLVGAHAISAWAGDPRATMDVDVIASRPAEARRVLEAAFPELTVEDGEVVIRFKREGREAIDVIRPTAAPIYRAALKHATRLKLGRVMVDVPKLEVAVALKFAAMVSRQRAMADRYQDAHDFIRMVTRHPVMDEGKLAELGEMVFAGGGAEVVKLVGDARAGRRLDF